MKSFIALLPVLALWIGGFSEVASADGRPHITQQQAVEIGNKHVLKMNIDLGEVDIDVDEGNKKWIEYMAILRDSPVPALKRQFHRYDARLKGHTYWSLLYNPKRVEGHGFKGGGATVLIDSRTGRVLLAIRGE